MAPSLLSMSSHASSASRPASSYYIDDGIRRKLSNHRVYRLELRKERDGAEHEFLILSLGSVNGKNIYGRIERRPSPHAGFMSKIRGCGAADTLTRIDKRHYETLKAKTGCEIFVSFRNEQDERYPEPRLYTIFTICDAIRKDPVAEEYTAKKYNCYCFARTIMLLTTRYFLLHQYRTIHQSPRSTFNDYSGDEIDNIVDKMMKKKNPWISIDFFSVGGDSATYKDLRRYVDAMNCKHRNWLNGHLQNGEAVYRYLNKKTDVIWRRMYAQSGKVDVVEVLSDVVADATGAVLGFFGLLPK